MYVNRCCISRRQKCDKEAENILKYKNLIIEIQRTWNVKTKEIAVITRATGTNSESLRHYLSYIP
jgi:hypothetical protein